VGDVVPVTQEPLWIRKLAKSSKVTVVIGIVQSIIIIWLYTHCCQEPKNNQNIEDVNNAEELRNLRRGSCCQF